MSQVLNYESSINKSMTPFLMISYLQTESNNVTHSITEDLMTFRCQVTQVNSSEQALFDI